MWGGAAFYGCSSLATVSLPSAITVDKYAFEDCTRSNIELTVKHGSTWWQNMSDGGSESDNYGWKKVIFPNFKSEYTKDDYKSWSDENCKYAPSRDDMCKYLGAGVYWDNGDAGKNQQTYTVDSSEYHTGLWVKKKAYIGTEVTGSTGVVPTQGRPEDINKYFFLPAAGRYSFGGFDFAGSYGVYWSISPDGNGAAYFLGFDSSYAYVFSDNRCNGYMPMVAE